MAEPSIPIYFDEPVRPKRTFIEDLTATGSEVRGAAFEEAFVHGATNAIARSTRLEIARSGRFDPFAFLGQGALNRFARQITGAPVIQVTDPKKLSPLVQADEANQEIKELGLPLKKFEGPVRRDYLDILIRAKQEELARKSIMARAPDGFFSQAGVFTAGLLASIVDPLNVASAFVPVVGPTRFAAMVARTGVVTARLGKGAIEGTVGAALLEPIVLSAADQFQADYTYIDSLVNLAFGTVMGAGLHAGGGAVADVVRRRRGLPTLKERLAKLDPGIQEAQASAAVAQIATGRAIDIEPIARQDPAWHDDGRIPHGIIPDDFEPSGQSLRMAGRFIDDQGRHGKVEVIGVRKDGTLNIFDTLKQAKQAFSKMSKARRQAFAIRELEDGTFALVRKTNAEVAVSADGTQAVFTDKRQATRARDRLVNLDAAAKNEVQVVEIEKGNFAVLRNATARDVADLRARPDLAELPDPTAFDDVNAFLERNGIDLDQLEERELAFFIESLRDGRADLTLDFEARLDALRSAHRDAEIAGDDYDGFIARQNDPSADLAASEFGTPYADAAAARADDDPTVSFQEVKEQFDAMAGQDPELKARLEEMTAAAKAFEEHQKAVQALGVCRARG